MKEKRLSATAGFVTGSFERKAYYLYFLGEFIFYGIVMGFLNLYLTEAGIPAMVVSAIFLGTKIWDAINDPLFGVLVDKLHLKRGKFIPWVRVSSLLVPLATILLFSIPGDAKLQVKILWAVAGYLIWDIAYTICDAPALALPTTMTDQVKERDRLYTMKSLFLFVGTITVSTAVPILYPVIGWSWSAVIMGVVGFAAMIPLGFTAKERYFIREEGEPSPTIRELFAVLLKNKYLLIFYGSLIILCLTDTTAAVAAYVAIHLLGSEKWIIGITLISLAPLVLSAFVVQPLLKRFDKFKIYIVALILMHGLNVITFMIGYKIPVLYLVMAGIKAMCAGVMGVVQATFIADCTEYGNFITGERATGITFSIQSLTAKITLAISGAVGMFFLGLAGFQEGAGAVQSQFTKDWIWRLHLLFPAISGILCIIFLLLFYKLRNSDVVLMAKANNGEITREEAIAGFSRKYL